MVTRTGILHEASGAVVTVLGWLLLSVGWTASLGAGVAVVARAVRRRGAAVRELAVRWGAPVVDHLLEVSTVGRLRDRRVEVKASRRVSVLVRTGVPAALPERGIPLPPAVSDAVDAGARLTHGTWWWWGPPGTTADELQRVAALLVAAAEHAGKEPTRAPEAPGAADPASRRARTLRRTALLAGRRPPGLTDEELGAWVDDPDPRVAVAAARALGPKGVEHLWRLTAADDGERRRAALVALAEVGADPARVEALLLELLGAGDEEVVAALGRVGGAASVPPLKALGATPFTARGRAVLDALGRIRTRLGQAPGVLAEAATGDGRLAEAPAPAGGGLAIPDGGREERATVEGIGPSRPGVHDG